MKPIIKNQNSKLSSIAIVGIVIGCTAFIAIIITIIYFVLKNRKIQLSNHMEKSEEETSSEKSCSDVSN